MAQRREFDMRKELVLRTLMSEEKDKSRKGGVDAPIADLIGIINSDPSFVTTSSCSGRVSIFLEQPSSALLKSDPYHVVEEKEEQNSGERPKVKQGGSWIYVSHYAADIDEVLLKVRRLYQETQQDGLLVFRFEPFILALECSSLAAAERLVACAMASGYRESGISSVGKRIIVAVRSSIRLEAPIGEKGKLLVHEEYLRFLTEIANKKFLLNQQRIRRFMSTLKSIKLLGHQVGQRRRNELSVDVRDRLFSNLQTRQSKILSRMDTIETRTGSIA